MEVGKALEARRAVNFFDPSATISRDELKAVYDKARLAPTSFNLQPFRIIAALSPEAKAALFEVAFKQPKVKDASATLVVVGDTEKYAHADEVWDDMAEKGYFPADNKEQMKGMSAGLYQGERGPAFASRNAGLFCMAFMLAAQEQGFDTHPMDGMDIDGVRKLYGLKENELPVMLIAIGRFDKSKSLLAAKMRCEFDDMVEMI